MSPVLEVPIQTQTDDEPVIIWQPFPGSQLLATIVPIREVLYEGTRGPGKTIWLLMSFAQHVGAGMARSWRGIIFRQTYKQLEEIIEKSLMWFNQIFPEADYNSTEHTWRWPTGESLLLRYMARPADYWNYHGHEYPFLGWDELTNWPTMECYHLMKSCNRSTNVMAARLKMIRATANPWGRGHNVVKAYFIDVAPRGHVYTDPETGIERIAIHGHFIENLALMEADPTYADTLLSATTGGEYQVKAWRDGDWDIVAGGMFDDLWNRNVHTIEPWPLKATSSSWRIDRAFDYGSSKPFSVGWWAESDGTVAPNGKIYPPKTLIRIAEWYGWDGQNPNVGIRMQDVDIAKGIKKREVMWGIRDRVRIGPADASIFHAEPGHKSIYDAMKGRAKFSKAAMQSGSRIPGWEAVRRRLKAAVENDHDLPHLYAFNTCIQFVRVFPVTPRDEGNPDDVDTETEDHIQDETRYRVTAPKREATTKEWTV